MNIEQHTQVYQLGKCLKRTVCVLMTFILACQPVLVSAAPSNPNITQQFKQVEERLEKLRTSIDQSKFDMDELLDQLDYDHENIVDYVRNKIAYEPYHGVLRGAKGALISQSGNSADQALLLVTLLKNAGFGGRLVVGSIDKERQSFLLNAASGTIKNMAPHSKPIEELAVKAAGVSRQLLEVLSQSSLALDLKTIIEGEIQDYFWVEFKESPSSEWVAIHPISSDKNLDQRISQKLSAREYFSDSIPDDLLHKVSIQFFIDQKMGDEILTHSLMDEYIRPSANLFTKNVSISILPASMSDPAFYRDLDETNKFWLNGELFFPVLNQAVPENVQLFDTSGNALPAEAASNVGALFSTVNRRTGAALDSIRKLGEDRSENTNMPSIQLKKLWYRVKLISPGGKQKNFDRTIVSRDQSMADEEFFSTIVKTINFSIANGRIHNEYIKNTYFEYMSAILQAEKTIYQSKVTGSDLDILATEASIEGYRLLLYHFLSNDSVDENTLLYRSSPNVISHIRSPLPTFTEAEVVDVISNEKVALKFSAGQIEVDQVSLFSAGVYETYLEGASFFLPKSQLKNTSTGLHSSSTIADSTVVAKLEDIDKLPKKFQETAREFLVDELKEGYVMIIPSDSLSGNDVPGWWRYNNETGTVLGMGIVDGYYGGVETAEYILSDALLTTAYIKVMKGTAAMLTCAFLFNLGKARTGALAVSGFTFACLKIGIDAETCGLLASIVGIGAGTVTGEAARTPFLVRCMVALGS